MRDIILKSRGICSSNDQNEIYLLHTHSIANFYLYVSRKVFCVCADHYITTPST